MKIVFDLEKELEDHPERVELTRALTLNSAKPELGLSGANGLFASEEWWKNVRVGKIPTLEITGMIQRAYFAGQGETGKPNMVDLLTDCGSKESVGIYANDKADLALFKEGRRATVLYALDELKKQPNPERRVNFSRIALEMRVSEN